MSENLLKWSGHNFAVLKALYSYSLKEELTDAVLCFQDGEVKVHKIVLSACSPKFEKLFKEGRNEIYLCDISKSSMDYLLEYMYRGHVLVSSEDLPGVLAAAEYFQVKGIHTNNGPQEGQERQQVEVLSNGSQKKQMSRNNSTENCCLPSSPFRRDRPKNVPKTITSITEKQLGQQKRRSKSFSEVFPPRKQQPPKSTKGLQNGQNSESSHMKQAGPSDSETMKVINPFARKQQQQPPPPPPAQPLDSDATFVEGASSLDVVVKVEPSDVVYLDDDDATSTSTRVLHSSDESELLFDAPSTSSAQRRPTRRPAKTPGDQFRSSEEEVEVDEDAARKKKKRKKVGENKDSEKSVPTVFVDTLVREPEHADPRKLKKYKDALEKTPVNDMLYFCPVCFDFFEDITEHLKQHKKVPRKLYPCSKCGKQFYDKKFLSFHRCVLENNDEAKE